MKTYVDTSVLVSALTSEAATPRAQIWLKTMPAGDALISEWVATEFSAALSIKFRRKEIDELFRVGTLTQFRALAWSLLETVEIKDTHFQAAAILADRYDLGLRAGDALHLAIAQSRGAAVATLDRRMITAATALGMRVEII